MSPPGPRGALRHAAGRSSRRLLALVAGARSSTGTEAVAITFDDGPDPELTPALLDVLDRFDVRATFFLIGERAVRHPSIVRRIVESGHPVGSHSMHHADFKRLAPEAAIREAREGRDALEQLTGRTVPLFRPPRGHLTFAIARFLRASDWQTWLWTTDSYDWKADLTAEAIAETAGQVEPGGVVLMHDDRPLTPAACERLLGELHARGVVIHAIDAAPVS